MNKHYLIAGTHCRSCEILLERHIGEVRGVRSVSVNYRTGLASVRFQDAQAVDERSIERAVLAAGYRFGHSQPRAWIATREQDWLEVIFAVCIVFALYLFAHFFGLSALSSRIQGGTTLPVVFTVGLVAGISTCAALIGGLVLAASARYAALHPQATASQKFRPHLFFNAGRLVSFALLGGLIGLAGSTLQPTPRLLGGLTVLVGVVMISLGLKLTELFPRLNTLLVLPGSIARRLGLSRTEQEYSHWRASLTGALTFFLPCGFTQAMQLAALSSGSFAGGSAIMAAFALGTAPGLLGIAGLSSLVRGEFARMFFKVAGIIVILLGVWNIGNGWNLTGFILFRQSPASAARGVQLTTSELRDGKQYLTMEQWAGGYNPNRFRVTRGVPLVWQINSTSAQTCASSLIVPAWGISRSLTAGNNTVEYTPQSTGTIKFSCSMGMFTGTIEVVE